MCTYFVPFYISEKLLPQLLWPERTLKINVSPSPVGHLFFDRLEKFVFKKKLDRNFQISDFKIFRFQISKFPDISFQKFQVSKFQISDLKIFRFQISNIPDFRIQNFQISEISDFKIFRFRKISIQVFFEDEFFQSVKR